MALASIATLWDTVRHHETLFAEPMTADTRSRLLRLVIFVLLPASIILHELGHAAAIRAVGREVLDFGFYFIYGYVSYNGYGLTPYEQGFIALAGPAVSVAIGLAALTIGWFKPTRAPINYVLLLFGALEIANALIFYPVLDALGGAGDGGDWRQIYRTETPGIMIPVAIVHATILAGGLLAWRSEEVRRGYAERTGQVYRTREQISRRSELARIMASAATQATDRWQHPVELVADAQRGGIQMVLRWQSRGFNRALLVHAPPLDGADPHIEIHAAIRALEPGLPPYERPLNRVDGQPNVDELAGYIRRALDTVDGWDGALTMN
ncbi:MAG TPA: site-2 protease family protein [Thermomicrobiales bacterium]|nr:site-2 protease family protein [Thermomicrobiales bacterium]